MNVLCPMEAGIIYKCIADPQHLRILNLLSTGPLCVCHLQDLLKESQIRISKQLNFLKRYGLLKAACDGNWRIDSLARPDEGLLRANLDYLNRVECNECAQLRKDRVVRTKLIQHFSTKGNAPEQVCEMVGGC